jgi:hypothetical protein
MEIKYLLKYALTSSSVISSSGFFGTNFSFPIFIKFFEISKLAKYNTKLIVKLKDYGVEVKSAIGLIKTSIILEYFKIFSQLDNSKYFL